MRSTELTMKKYLANVITSLRIIGSVVLLFFDTPSLPFCITYLLCGISDMADGIIARKTKTVSNLGAKLDTVADMVFVVVCSMKLLPMISLPILLWIWIGVIATMKVANIVWGFIHTKKLLAFHTVLNKATGLLLFSLPFTLQIIAPPYSIAVVCIVATIAAIQESYYTYEETLPHSR